MHYDMAPQGRKKNALSRKFATVLPLCPWAGSFVTLSPIRWKGIDHWPGSIVPWCSVNLHCLVSPS